MLVVLCYHKVGFPVTNAEDRKLNVSSETFARHVRWFSKHRWQSLTFPQLAERGFNTIGNTVVFTFDDAYTCAVESASPILASAGMTGTFFAVPGLAGKTSEWDHERAAPLADWGQLRELKRQGFAIENHTFTHPRLAELSMEAMLQQIKDAEEAIFEQLKHRPTTLCYPYGSYNREVCAAVQSLHYKAACTVKTGLTHPETPPLEVPRIKIAYRDGLGGLLYKLYIRPRLN